MIKSYDTHGLVTLFHILSMQDLAKDLEPDQLSNKRSEDSLRTTQLRIK